MFDQLRVVGEPRVEELGVPADTYLSFQFRDHLPNEVVVRLVVLVFVVGFLVLAKHERIGGFVVGVERVDEVLAPDGFGVIGELPSTGKLLPGSLEHRVIGDDDDDDVAVP